MRGCVDNPDLVEARQRPPRARERQTAAMVEPSALRMAGGRRREGRKGRTGGRMTGREQINRDEEEERAEDGKRGKG